MKLRRPYYPSREKVAAVEREFNWLDVVAEAHVGGREDFWRRVRREVERRLVLRGVPGVAAGLSSEETSAAVVPET